MATAQDNSGLEVAGLSVERGGRLVIADLSFETRKGEALLLTGPNGAGKTTLLRTIAGLLAPRAGQICLSGSLAGLDDDEQRVSEHCHYVAYNNAANTDLTVRENLLFWGRFLGGGDAQDIEAAIEKVGLAALADIPVRYLSAGQQRRVAIGRLLAVHKPVWLLDEPSVSLDAVNTAGLIEFGNMHLAGGGMIIAATHLPLGFEPRRELRLEPIEPAMRGGDDWAGFWADFGAGAEA